MKNTMNGKSHCFLPCCIWTKFVCTSTGRLIPSFCSFIATCHFMLSFGLVTRSMQRCCVKLAATTPPRMSRPFRRFTQNSKCSLGLGCINNHSRGNDQRLLQLSTLLMWLRTLTNLSESLVLEINHNQLSAVQNKTRHIK
jgi:hypothetical protein